jgi:CRP-like cAMP-binding protein
MLTEKERARILARVGASSVRLPPAEWRALEGLLKPRRLAKGEEFIRPGDSARRIGIVRAGLLRFYYVDPDGDESTKAFRGPGELAAAYAEAISGVPSRTFIQALEDSEILEGDYARVTALFSRHPAWQELARRVAEHFYVTKERREFEFLQLSAEQRWRQFDRAYPGLASRIPQYHIASYLGVTPVALSRIVSRAKHA